LDESVRTIRCESGLQLSVRESHTRSSENVGGARGRSGAGLISYKELFALFAQMLTNVFRQCQEDFMTALETQHKRPSLQDPDLAGACIQTEFHAIGKIKSNFKKKISACFSQILVKPYIDTCCKGVCGFGIGKTDCAFHERLSSGSNDGIRSTHGNSRFPAITTTGAQMLSRPENLPSVVRRMTAGQMLLDGASIEAVAEQLHLSTQTVKRYQTIVSTGGLEALRKMGVGGRSSALDQQALEWIAAALQGPARAHGFESDTWTNARLRALIEQRYGVRFSRVYIWQIATNLGLGHLLSKSRR
jgi:transposase